MVNRASLRGAGTIEERIFWSLVCVRALVHAIVAYPELDKYVLIQIVTETKLVCDMDGLDQHINSLMRESLGRLRLDLEEVQSTLEYQKTRQRHAIQLLMDRWATRGRTSPEGARNADGDVIADLDQGAEIFLSYWKQ